METFKIRTYGRTELALLYSPCLSAQGAYRKLMKWIVYHPGLSEQLAELGLNPRSRVYTPAQVKVIVEALGEP